MAIKQEYRLSVLLEMRERKKEDAERYLGECIQALKKAQERLQELKTELERMIADRENRRREYSEKVMRGEMSAQDAVSAEKFIERLKEKEERKKEEIEAQKDVVKARERDVEGARADLVAATRDLKALQKHKEKWAEQVKKEMMAREEEAADDLSQTIFLGQQRERNE